MADRSENTPRFHLRIGDLADTLVRLDTIVLGAWAPDLLRMKEEDLFAQRKFAYFGGADRDAAGTVTFPDGNWIECPDESESIVQRTRDGSVVSVGPTLDKDKYGMAWVKCEGGAITEIEDIRDLGITPADPVNAFQWRNIRIETGLLELGEFQDGSFPVTPLSTIMAATGNIPLWLRLYASAADAAADAGRGVGDPAPAGYIVLQVQFGPSLLSLILNTATTDGVPAISRCLEALTALFWRIDLLEAASFQVGLLSFTGGVARENIGLFRTTGAVSDDEEAVSEEYYIEENDGISTFGGLHPKGSPTGPLRWPDTLGPVDHNSLDYRCTALQGGVDDAGHFLYLTLFMMDEPFVYPWDGDLGEGHFDNTRYLFAGFQRTGSGGVEGLIGWIDAAGAEHVLASDGGHSWPLGSTKDFTVKVRGNQVELYLDTTLICSATVDPAIMTPCNRYLGLHSGRELASSGLVVYELEVTRGDEAVAVVDLTVMEREP